MKTLIITGLISSLLMMASCHKEDQKEEQKMFDLSDIELEGILDDYNTGITLKNLHDEKSNKVIESLIDEAFELAEEDKKRK